jgi:hypothetical protein
LYRFVRSYEELFDGYESHADLGVVLPHRAFLKNLSRWFEICNRLAAHGRSYRLLLAGNEIVDHPLSSDDLSACRVLLVPDRENLLSSDRELVSHRVVNGSCCTTVSWVIRAVTAMPTKRCVKCSSHWGDDSK